MKLGVALARVRSDLWSDVARAAEETGYESVWVSEHLVLPTLMAGSPMHDADHPPLPPTTPIWDTGAALGFLAAITHTLRLGTFVHLLAIRHPFISARVFASADILSGGRVEVGVGAGWLREEWEAAGLDPRTRGRRLDESIAVCRRLWTEPTVSHEGDFWSFPDVAFEPKPVQTPLPVLVGGESPAALARAARIGDGWIGMDADPGRAAQLVGDLRRAEDRLRPPGRPRCTITLSNPHPSGRELEAYRDLGVDRLIVSPWRRSADAVDSLVSFAPKAAI